MSVSQAAPRAASNRPPPRTPSDARPPPAGARRRSCAAPAHRLPGAGTGRGGTVRGRRRPGRRHRPRTAAPAPPGRPATASSTAGPAPGRSRSSSWSWRIHRRRPGWWRGSCSRQVEGRPVPDVAAATGPVGQQAGGPPGRWPRRSTRRTRPPRPGGRRAGRLDDRPDGALEQLGAVACRHRDRQHGRCRGRTGACSAQGDATPRARARSAQTAQGARPCSNSDSSFWRSRACPWGPRSPRTGRS